MSLQFPAHCEPLVRAALLAVIETIPLGQEGPMLAISIVPVWTPPIPRFTLDEAEGDVCPEAVSGVAEDLD